MYIQEFKDVIDQDFVNRMEDLFYDRADEWEVPNTNKVSKLVEYTGTQLKIHDEDLVEEMSNLVMPYVDKYVKSFGPTANGFGYYLSHITLIKYNNMDATPLHYDASAVQYGDDISLRDFVTLMYLNDEYDGGDLVFPAQGEIVEPAKGKLAIFPANFMFPHTSYPTIGTRYMLRFGVRLKSDTVDKA